MQPKRLDKTTLTGSGRAGYTDSESGGGGGGGGEDGVGYVLEEEGRLGSAEVVG